MIIRKHLSSDIQCCTALQFTNYIHTHNSISWRVDRSRTVDDLAIEEETGMEFVLNCIEHRDAIESRGCTSKRDCGEFMVVLFSNRGYTFTVLLLSSKVLICYLVE